MEDKLIRNEQEAIECIKNNMPSSGYEMLKESLNMAIEALEKQIAKEPRLEGDGYAPDGSFVFDTWICPNCSEHYEIDFEEHAYCPVCGQKIKHNS